MLNQLKFLTLIVSLLAVGLSAQDYYWNNGEKVPVKKSSHKNYYLLSKKKAVTEALVTQPAPADEVPSWPCGADGSNLTCTYENNTLTVSGTGRMKDYGDPPNIGPGPGPLPTPEDAPWGPVDGVVIEGGVTYIGKGTLSGALGPQTFVAKVSATNPPEVHASAFNNVDFANAVLRVPNSATAAYSTAPVWKDFGNINKYKVTFDSRGGSDIGSQFISYGSTAEKPNDPTRSTFTFGGWYKDVTCSELTGECTYVGNYDFSAETVSDDITLFAKWTSTTSVVSDSRVIPAKPDETAVVIAPAAVLSGEFTAGPNPTSKGSGGISFFRQGKRASGTLTVYDASGNVIKKIAVKDNAVGTQAKRKVAAWDLTDKKGRPIPEGTYLVKGKITTTGGNSEKVSVIVGVR